MKRYVLPEEGTFYKANLHCHSTCSDGTLTPEEIKEIYKSNGYSVVAYSDHNVLIDHSELDDEDFLTITSCEINYSKNAIDDPKKDPCFHINFFAEDQHNDIMPFYNPKYYFGKSPELKNTQKYLGTPDYIRRYENTNEMIKMFADNGFFASLNHPTWSLQTLDDLRDVEGAWAMEIYNNSCYHALGYEEENGHLYNDLLRMGKKLFCSATDDNHNHRNDSCGGFVMIKAPSLTYENIIKALKNGDFYASTGPEIKELYVEDGTLHIKTSPVHRISVCGQGRQACFVMPEDIDGTVTEASFNISNMFPEFIRVTVTDTHGRQAWSQPIFDL